MVETYLSRHVEGEPEATVARVEAAVRATATGGEQIRYLRSIFVPDDESCLLLIEAPSVAAVERLLVRAELTSIRVAYAVTAEGSLPTACRAANPVPRGRGRC